ncbi:MAG: hypothetical protein WBW33_11930 [Bryobacteraceae bacterium]
MKSLSFVGVALLLCSAASVAAATDPLPLSSRLPKPAPLIILVDGPDAESSALPAANAAPAEAVEPTVDAVPASYIGLVQPAPVEAEASTAAVAANKSSGTVNKVWTASIAALLGGTAMDAASSWGKAEANPILRSANGTFGLQGLMIKGALAGAVLAPEILMRNNEEAKKKFAIVNFIAAGVFSAVVFHNLTVPKLK